LPLILGALCKFAIFRLPLHHQLVRHRLRRPTFNARKACCVGRPATQGNDSNSNIEQSALLSSVQNHQSARRRNRIGGRKTLVNSSKSDLMVTDVTDVTRQTFQSFNRINKIVMNLNIMSCTV